MSDTFPYKEIKVPNLNDSGYALNAQEVIDNINDNFAKLANYDFHKGADGESLYTVKINLKSYNVNIEPNDIDLNYIYKDICYWNILETLNYQSTRGTDFLIYDTVILTLDKLSEKEENDIINYWKTDLRNDALGYPDGQEKFEYICGLLNKHISYIHPIIFLDPLVYSNSNYDLSSNKYFNEKSCILQFSNFGTNINNGLMGKEADIYQRTTYYTIRCELKVIKALPTLYYDTNKELICWKFGDNKTGLPAQGPRGENGNSGLFLLVKIGDIINGVADVKQIYYDKWWKIDTQEGFEIWETKATELEIDINGVACIAIPDENSVNEDKNNIDIEGFYLTAIRKDGQTYVVDVPDDLNIALNLEENELFNRLTEINSKSDNTSLIKGLFIPYSIESDGKIKAHTLYGSPWSETESDLPQDNRKHLHLSPKEFDNKGAMFKDSTEDNVSFTIDYPITINGNTTIKQGDVYIENQLQIGHAGVTTISNNEITTQIIQDIQSIKGKEITIDGDEIIIKGKLNSDSANITDLNVGNLTVNSINGGNKKSLVRGDGGLVEINSGTGISDITIGGVPMFTFEWEQLHNIVNLYVHIPIPAPGNNDGLLVAGMCYLPFDFGIISRNGVSFKSHSIPFAPKPRITTYCHTSFGVSFEVSKGGGLSVSCCKEAIKSDGVNVIIPICSIDGFEETDRENPTLHLNFTYMTDDIES